MKLFNAEVGSQKRSRMASFSGSDAVLTSLTVEQLCSSLVANHMDVVNVIQAGAFNDLASEPLNSR
ncbi:hypothetical protein L1D44_18940 [Shewanella sp. Isolate13]|uniref:hypothetical protein n=1 Tax=Shewanella sp. Isolate13 TaxID=2908531 RepID=UPI001EFD2772|nr:hypothetical protein [Shewanella sp. Isolate13]MCG9731869.1 hypothetical protein [Shewanella sp. Isolate13]